ncbi:MAG: SurA N-terminal domain-containing protein [Gammaproteobacteria bacterium]|nr:SurA N-terminal domain-containing protein [Gammaproteobacteria bacterium]
MMNFFREHAKGVITWIILVIIVIAFGLVGVNAYIDGDGKTIVATVEDVDIQLPVFQRAYQQERAYRQQLLGGRVDPALMNEETLKREALRRVIDSEVVTQSAREAGMRIGDAQLADQIRMIRQFQRDGRFDQATYSQLLRNQGLSEAEFEDSMRRDLLASQWVSGLIDTELATPAETASLLALRGQQRRIGYMTLDRAAYLKDVSVAEEEIGKYYDGHREQYAIPEKMTIEYLELSAAELQSAIEVTDEALQQMYQEHGSDQSVPEERRASHILIQLDDKADAASKAKAEGKAKDILARARKGEDFAALARKYSDDPGSASRGGDLDYFARGVMAKPFEEAAFAMKKGAVSDIVRTSFGLHIIKLTDVRGGQTRPFAELRDTLTRQYRDQKAEERFFELADRLTDLTYEHPDTLDVAAQELGLKIKTSDWFERGLGTGIAQDDRVRQAAFAPEVLESGHNSEAVTLTDTHVIVLRKREHQPVSYRPVEAVKAQIIELLRAEAAQQRVVKEGEAVLARLIRGEDPVALAKQAHGAWKTPGMVGRQSQGGAIIPAEVLQQAFRLPQPAAGQAASNGGVALAGGGYALVTLYEVKDSDPAAASDQDRKMAQELLMRQRSGQVGAALIENMKGRLDIREHADRI